MEGYCLYGTLLLRPVQIRAHHHIDVYVVRRRGRLAPRQPLSVCALLPA